MRTHERASSGRPPHRPGVAPHADDASVAVPARAALPPWATKRLADDFDWPTTIVAAFSFLLHFGALGATYSDWADVVVDDDVHTAVLVESLRPTTAPPTVEVPATAVPESASGAATSAPREKARRGPATGASPIGGAQPGSQMGDGAATHLLAELARHDLQVVAALAGRGPATDGVLRGGELPTELLDQAAGDAAGAGRGARSGLDLGRATSLVPGRSSGLEALGSTERAAPTGTGASTRPSAPKGRLDVQSPTTLDCAVPNAPAVVGALSARFRVCYQRGLADEDPAMQGSVRIVARIGPNGEVASVSTAAVSGLSAKVVACVADRVHGAQFDAPSCGGATVVIPARFYPQR
jgi:hypothetical protein